MRFLNWVFERILVLANAVLEKHEEEQREWERSHDAQQVEAVRKAYPKGWKARDSL